MAVYGGQFYDKPRDPLNVSDIAGASSTSMLRLRVADPRVVLDAALQGTSSRKGHFLSEGRQVDPLKPSYSLPSFTMAEYGPPRSITELMHTRIQWMLQQPEGRQRQPTTAHTLDYSDVNEKTFRQRFRASSNTRQNPPFVDDVANAKAGYRSVPPRDTNALNPEYRGLSGKPLPAPDPKLVPGGRRYMRTDAEKFSMRTDDIDRCFADAFSKKYGAFATRPSNFAADIFGAQHDTRCREPQVWRASGPYIDPGTRRFPDALHSKQTNRIDDIQGAQTAKSRDPMPVRMYREARESEAQAVREFPTARSPPLPAMVAAEEALRLADSATAQTAY
ncbi:hypothetical protein T492DRAFT_1042666 [Pavlovales sp. CCMP2436]|nr:hypothetical protein T492DRAFT_1042666 [Pavlovales sp. CCMP2436]